MKTISCGVFITDGRYILCGKVSGNTFMDIPKGIGHEFESNIETVGRETYEEFNVDIKKLPKPIDLGEFDYRMDKNLHLFVIKVKSLQLDEDILYIDKEEFKLKCNSTFNLWGNDVPEIESFHLVDIQDFHNMSCNSMRRTFLNNKIDIILSNI